MSARAIEDAREQLRRLQCEQWGDLGLGLAALTVAVGATQFHRALAVPLLLGGLVVGARGMRAVWRRWDLVDRLVGDPDAYVIAEVSAYAARQATMARRHSFAAAIRGTIRDSAPSDRISAAAGELEALARELDDEDLALEPPLAVACMRLVEDPVESSLLGPGHASEELPSRIYRIRAGFSPRGAHARRQGGSDRVPPGSGLAAAGARVRL
jgi:hypothetical protein